MCIRTFRIGRMLRLLKKAHSLKIIFTTLIITFPALVNVMSLLVLFLLMYSILGVQFFAQVKLNENNKSEFNNKANFQTIWTSFLLIFRTITGEDWNQVMWHSIMDKDDPTI